MHRYTSYLQKSLRQQIEQINRDVPFLATQLENFVALSSLLR